MATIHIAFRTMDSGRTVAQDTSGKVWGNAGGYASIAMANRHACAAIRKAGHVPADAPAAEPAPVKAASAPRLAYHSHTGACIGAVIEADRKQVRVIKEGREFVARRVDVTLSAVTAEQAARVAAAPAAPAPAPTAKPAATPSSAIIYAGPSMLDGSPIVAIATGLGKGSSNEKTGAMVQVWIIRSDVDPITASRTGQDAAICGDCPHRGTATPERASGWAKGRSCYVNLVQAPRSVFATFQRGGYDVMPLDTFADAIRGKGLRLGAYGDPAAVPFWVWAAVCPSAAFCNGYTHAWRSFPELNAWCMASADSSADRAAAKVLGFRVFRVRTAAQEVEAKEVVCPASAEAGKKVVCAECRACGGHSAKAKADIVIVAHGSGASAFQAAA